MKKIIVFLMTILISIVLTGCGVEEPQVEHTHPEYDYQQDIDQLAESTKNSIDELTSIIDQLEIDIATQNEQYSELEQVLNQLTQTTSYTYGIDEYGNYITFAQLGDLLIEKYFGDYAIDSDGLYYQSDKIEMRIKVSSTFLVDNDINDITARLILLTNEFKNYTLYNQLKNSYVVSVQIIDDITVESMQFGFDTSLFNYIELTPKNIINQEYEIYFVSMFSQPSITLVENYMQNDFGDPVLDIE